MAVAEVSKVLIAGHKNDEEKVLSRLRETELIEIIRTATPSLSSATWEIELTELKAAIEFLEKSSGEKKGMIDSFFPSIEATDEKGLANAYRDSEWKKVIAGIKNIETEQGNIRNAISGLESDIRTLSHWTALDAPLEKFLSLKKVGARAGKVGSKASAGLIKKLGEASANTAVLTAEEGKTEVFLAVFYLKGEEKTVTEILDKSGFVKIELPASPRTPKEELAELELSLKEYKKRLLETAKEAKELSKSIRALRLAYDYLYLIKTGEEKRSEILLTRSLFVIEGWIRSDDIEKARKIILQSSSAAEIIKIMPKENELPPVIIENLPVFRPFELITRIFGLPLPNEIDPTAALSFFYLLFFAICLSDVGYGVALAAASFIMMKKLPLSTGGKNLLLLLFWGGLLTVPIGIATGSYFGVAPEALPNHELKNLLISLRVIDPIKNPLNVLILSLILGVVQNICGLMIAFFGKIRNRQYVDGLLDYGLWIFFLLSLCAIPFSGIFSYASIAGAVLLVLTQGRNEPGIVKKATSGILSLYKTTGYLGDTLSYSRLLALMMTTSIIGMVVNILAGLTMHSVPVLGYVIMALILIVGHGFNLVVSVLGAFIHAMRLQLVEFFGKFYEGGGREFRPFKRETKYIPLV